MPLRAVAYERVLIELAQQVVKERNSTKERTAAVCNQKKITLEGHLFEKQPQMIHESTRNERKMNIQFQASLMQQRADPLAFLSRTIKSSKGNKKRKDWA